MSKLDIRQVIEGIENIDTGLAIYDDSFKLLYANHRAKDLLPDFMKTLKAGGSLTNAIRDQVKVISPDVPNSEIEAQTSHLAHCVKSGEEVKVPTVNNRWMKLFHAPMRSGGYVGFAVDVTVDHKREQEIKKAHRAADAANAAKTEFLASMSHEIRTPLNGILGMAQALSAKGLSAEDQDMVDTILDSSRSLMTILNDILDLSKIEAGQLDLSPIPVDFRHRLARMQKFFRPTAEDKGLFLNLVVAPHVPANLVIDPVRVRQIIMNLVSNSIKFTKEGGITLAASADLIDAASDRYRVSVHIHDTGIGIAAEQRERLFNKFTQADASTTRQYGGTGLGLPIARRLANMMDGDITVTSEIGRGSIFTFTFEAQMAKKVSNPGTGSETGHGTPAKPRLVKPESLQPNSQQQKSAGGDFSGRLAGRRVLIVDDNAINRRVARLFVEPSGLTVFEAANGREALISLSKQPIDFVLLDMHMPVMDGPETIRRIRAATSQVKNIPVIALTADAMSEDRAKCIELGMDGYVSKPVDQNELFVEIMRVLDLKQNEYRATGS